MTNILITGSDGQVGSELKVLEPDFKKYNFFFTDLKELDITEHKLVEKYILKNRINVIINCAAFTAVDLAETKSKKANEINNRAVRNIANLAKDHKIKLIHISTDYVFDGKSSKPYVETDTPNPGSVYGKTKLDGELAMQQINPLNSIIIRTSWLYSKFGNNFVKTMLHLAETKDKISLVADQIGSPTYAADLAKAILNILPQINNETVELFHYSNHGVCSWYDFGKAIFDLKEISIIVNPIESAMYPTPAQRPFYSVLDKSRIKDAFQLEVPLWKDSLISCLKTLKNEI